MSEGADKIQSVINSLDDAINHAVVDGNDWEEHLQEIIAVNLATHGIRDEVQLLLAVQDAEKEGVLPPSGKEPTTRILDAWGQTETREEGGSATEENASRQGNFNALVQSWNDRWTQAGAPGDIDTHTADILKWSKIHSISDLDTLLQGAEEAGVIHAKMVAVFRKSALKKLRTA